MQECVNVSSKEIEILVDNNRNANLNSNEKVIQVKNSLLEGLKKLF